MKSFKDFNIKSESRFSGEKIKVSKILNKEINVLAYKVDQSKFEKDNFDKCLCLQIEIDGEKRVVFSGSKVLISQITQIDIENMPFTTTIIKEGEHFEFT